MSEPYGKKLGGKIVDATTSPQLIDFWRQYGFEVVRLCEAPSAAISLHSQTCEMCGSTPEMFAAISKLAEGDRGDEPDAGREG